MLTRKIIKKLNDSETIKGKIADALGKSVPTVTRWLRHNDPMLTTAASLAVIREETGLTDEEILTTEVTK